MVIEGPKACGKTATALQVAASTVEVDTDPNVVQLMATVPSLAVAALEASPASLMRDLAYAGHLFESQVIHDLRVYSGRTVAHARDSTGAKVDAVIDYVDGTVLLVEARSGGNPR